MRGINRTADIEINVGGLLEQQSRDQRRSVTLKVPFFVQFVVSERVLCVFDDFVDRDDALGN